jgi:hypothetical protein
VQTGTNTTFKWRWPGELQDGWFFEIRIWKEETPKAGAFDAREVTKSQPLPDNTYEFSGDVASSVIVQEHKTGEYVWDVVVVELEPTYRPIGPEATPHKIQINYVSNGPPGSTPPKTPPSG